MKYRYCSSIRICSQLPTFAAVLSFGLKATAQTSSVNQLLIQSVGFDKHCHHDPAVASDVNQFDPTDKVPRNLTITGVNFNNGATPLVTLGSLQLNLVSYGANTIYATLDCSTTTAGAGTYRLTVSTGTGQPYNDSFFLSLATIGPNGNNGTNGSNGTNGNNGASGKDGAPGQNGNNGSNGRDGAPGLNGLNAHMHIYSAHLGNASISNTTTPIISKTGTGSPFYLVSAKLNAPYGNNQKQITCYLRNSTDPTHFIDSADQVWIPGSSTVAAKHTIVLEGSWAGVPPITTGVDPASLQTFTVDCQTADGTASPYFSWGYTMSKVREKK